MLEDFRDIDGLFRDSLENHTETPTEDIWKYVNSKLDSDEASKYKRKFIQMRRFVISFIFLLVGVTLYQVLSQNKNSSHLKIKKDSAFWVDDLSKFKSPKKIENESLANGNSEKAKAIESRKSVRYVVGNRFHRNGSVRVGNSDFQFETPVFKNLVGMHILNSQIRNTDGVVNSNFDIPDISWVYQHLGHIITKFLDATNSPDRSGLNSRTQKQKSSNRFKPYLTFTVFAAPVWARQNLADNDDYISNQSGGSFATPRVDKAVLQNREVEKVSFNIGVSGKYQLSRKFGIETGVTFTNTYVNINPQEIYAVRTNTGEVSYQFVTSTGYGLVNPKFASMPSPGDSLKSSGAKHSMQYVSVPLSIRYTIYFGRIAVMPGLGLTANFLTRTIIEAQLQDLGSNENILISKLQGSRGAYLSAGASVQFNYKIGGNWSASVIPSFSYAITPVTENNVVRTYPYNFSMGFGMTYQF